MHVMGLRGSLSAFCTSWIRVHSAAHDALCNPSPPSALSVYMRYCRYFGRGLCWGNNSSVQDVHSQHNQCQRIHVSKKNDSSVNTGSSLR